MQRMRRTHNAQQQQRNRNATSCCCCSTTMGRPYLRLLVLSLSAPAGLSYSGSSRGSSDVRMIKVSENRRAFLTSAATSAAALLTPLPGLAFENRLDDKYADATPQVGTQPADLGVSSRPSKSAGSYTGLAPCPNRPTAGVALPPLRIIWHDIFRHGKAGRLQM